MSGTQPGSLKSNPWEEKNVEDRKIKFVKAFEELEKIHKIKLIGVPQYVPSGQQGFNTSIMLVPIDMKNRSIPSPMNDEEIIK